MLQSLNQFIDEIESNKIESITKILRIKNGFSSILNWNDKNIEDCNYVDLKMNVIFCNKNKTESQIVELQFLLDFLLKAKKMGHKYYGIKRKKIQVESINNIISNTYNNYSKYKNKILSLTKDSNTINQLALHLFLSPNCIFSMIGEKGPFLSNINNPKMYNLFLDCLFHFGEILLNEKKALTHNKGCYNGYKSNRFDKMQDKINSTVANQKLFITKYLNFSLGDEPCISHFEFVK